MIIFESTLRDLLIQANVGVDKRVFLARAPQKPAAEQQVPYIVFFMVGPLPVMTQLGPLNQIERDYQVSIFHTAQTTALAIADTLRMYLDGMRGTFENVRLGHIFYTTQTLTYEEDTRLFHVIQEYRIMFSFLESAVATSSPNRSNQKEYQNARR